MNFILIRAACEADILRTDDSLELIDRGVGCVSVPLGAALKGKHTLPFGRGRAATDLNVFVFVFRLW